MKINWNIVSRYRNELFGIAAILVMVTHVSGYTVPEGIGGIIYKICQQGSMGVDIFLFLSGMGLYYSLKKDSNIRNFYLKRVKRVIIPYFVLAIPGFMILDLAIRHVTIEKFLIDVFLVSFWLQGDFILWYISFIIILYLIYPVIYFLFLKKENSNLKFLICFSFTVLLNIWLLYYMPEIYNRFEIALNRMPIFILGCWGGKWVYDKKNVSIWFPLAALIMFVILKGILIYYRGMIPDEVDLLITRGSFGAGAFAIILLAPVILDKTGNRWVIGALRWIGGLSLEIYIIHMFWRWIHLSIPFGSKSAWTYFVFILPASLLTAKIYEEIRNRIGRS